MNFGLKAGAERKRVDNEFGKIVRGVDFQHPDYEPVLLTKNRVKNAPLLQRTLYPAVHLTTYPTPFVIARMLWTGSLWAAIGEGQFSTTTDLQTWTTPVVLPVNANSTWATLGYNGSQYVIISEDVAGQLTGNIYTAYSTTGASWSAGNTLSGYTGGEYNGLHNIHWDGTAYIAASQTKDVGFLRSTTGTTWAVATGTTGLRSNGLAVSSTKMISVGNNYDAIVSTDHGATWSSVNSIARQAGNVSYVNNRFLCYSRAGFITSTDASSWSYLRTNFLIRYDLQDASLGDSASAPVYYKGYYVAIPSWSGVQYTNSIALFAENYPYELPAFYTFAEETFTFYRMAANSSSLVVYPGGQPTLSNIKFGNVAKLGVITIDPSEMEIPRYRFPYGAPGQFVKVR